MVSGLSGNRTMVTGPTEVRATTNDLTGSGSWSWRTTGNMVTSYDHCFYESRALAPGPSGLTRTTTIGLWFNWPRTTAAQRLMGLIQSRIQNLLMDWQVAKETRDAPIRMFRCWCHSDQSNTDRTFFLLLTQRNPWSLKSWSCNNDAAPRLLHFQRICEANLWSKALWLAREVGVLCALLR